MNVLKANTTISCEMKRTKSIKVEASTKEEATLEAIDKVSAWKDSLKGKNCKTCQSIINDVAA